MDNRSWDQGSVLYAGDCLTVDGGMHAAAKGDDADLQGVPRYQIRTVALIPFTSGDTANAGSG